MSSSADVPPFLPARRIRAVAAAYGAVAGAVAGLALTLMNGAQHLIWHGAQSPVRSAATILFGGVIIVLLRRKHHHLDTLDTLDSLIAESEDPVAVHWRRMGDARGAGLRKPLAALLLCALGAGTGALIPLMVATLVGAVIARLLPEREQHWRGTPRPPTNGRSGRQDRAPTSFPHHAGACGRARAQTPNPLVKV